MNIEIQDGIRVYHLEERDILEVRIPVCWPRMMGRKTLAVPGSMYRDAAEPAVREALVRAHSCQKKLLKGEAASVKALARNEQTDKSQLSKILRLTSLAPDIQKDILQEFGHWPLTLQQLMQPFPLEWQAQRNHFRQMIEKG